MPRLWTLVVAVLGLGMLMVVSPFMLFAPDHGDGLRIGGWRAVDGLLLLPADAPSEYAAARPIDSFPDFMSGLGGNDGAFGYVTYMAKARCLRGRSRLCRAKSAACTAIMRRTVIPSSCWAAMVIPRSPPRNMKQAHHRGQCC
ncbi:hypothetical protein [Kordiimonas gwangyangensis]|uniref:hypothetical protein n=1 Tax=Kordiimonas gwangyangensis TaxID=288022 RepID=UPI001EE31D1C|nr:hypothetical protein [Kordiimonas gwangyangensis]